MKVFYDDKCKVCNKEVAFYKKLGVKSISWIGIHKDANKLDYKNITKENYLKKMHVIDDNNQLKTGVDAFIALWKKYKYFKYLAIIINIYPIKYFVSKIYSIFAKYRFKRLYNSS